MTNSMPSGQTKSTLYPVLFWLLMAACLLIAIDGAVSYERTSQRYQDEQQFYQQLSRLQQQGQGAELPALEALQQQAQLLQLAVPTLDYQVLYRHWLAGLSHFETLAAGAENRYVSSDLDQLRNDVHQSLLQLRGECDKQLRRNAEDDRQTNEQRWAVYNLRGAVSVMMAYSLLEFAQDSDKSRTFLGDAVEDFKQAIRAVDQGAVLPVQRMVPRWNLELIVGSGESLVVGRSLGGDSVEALRGQLQAVVPNVGGYASGVPLETRVRK
ncbi:MAG: hypothetical protein J7K75_07540 [Desulfuromonas sp.]|nr:hypothetical protein [Desulfuromonas sp.]